MSTVHYRARLVLEEVFGNLTEQGHKQERTDTIAEFTVTGGDPHAAIHQARTHVEALAAWHQPATSAMDEAIAAYKEVDRCPSCAARYRRRPVKGCTNMWHQPEAEIEHEMPAHMLAKQEEASA